MSYSDFIAEESEAEAAWITATTAQPAISQTSTQVDDPFADEYVDPDTSPAAEMDRWYSR